MFIKILTPNHNGKIELTVKDLEALIQEAVDKAIAEDRANRPIQFWYGDGDINKINRTPNLAEINCNDSNITLFASNNSSKHDVKATGGTTFMKAINDMIGE